MVCLSTYFVVQGASSVIIDVQNRRVAVCLPVSAPIVNYILCRLLFK